MLLVSVSSSYAGNISTVDKHDVTEITFYSNEPIYTVNGPWPGTVQVRIGSNASFTPASSICHIRAIRF